MQDLIGYAKGRTTPLEESITAHSSTYQYFLMQMPLNILIPPKRTLTRLRLTLSAEHDRQGRGAVVAYDLFPPDAWQTAEHDIGDASVDVSKALMFLCPVAADALGLKLTIPIRWHSTHRVDPDDRPDEQSGVLVPHRRGDQQWVRGVRDLAVARWPSGRGQGGPGRRSTRRFSAREDGQGPIPHGGEKVAPMHA